MRTSGWPPKRQGSNVIDSQTRGATGRIFACYGTFIREMNRDELPQGLSQWWFRTYSMYCRDDEFRIVNYDATQCAVGDADPRMGSGDSSGEDEPSIGTPEHGWITWQPLRFRWRENHFYDSTATLAGDRNQLRVQRADQPWVARYLPTRYHTRRRTTETRFGGMNGSLPLLLGLIVFAYPVNMACSVLTSLFIDGRWGTDSNVDIGAGCESDPDCAD